MEPGTVLAGKYRIGHVLGRGGMGVVAFAQHLQLKQPVAIKLLHPVVGDDGDAVQRLLREAQAAAGLRSEHVARVLDVGALADGTPFIVMEYLEGRDVASLLRAGPLAPEVAVDIVVQACEALAAAHALGIVHRDLKPSNLFVTHRLDGSTLVKVLDFGISKTPVDAESAATPTDVPPSPADAIDTQPSGDPARSHTEVAAAPAPIRLHFEPTSTRTEAVMGTPGYMSPEHMRSSKHVDARTDIWSIGIVLYELLSGRRPFHAETRAALRVVVERAPLPPLGARVPPGLARVVARCLEKAPADRFPDVAALVAALAPFAPTPALAEVAAARIGRVRSAARASTDADVAHEMRAAPPRRAMGRWGLALAVAVTAALIAVATREPARSLPVVPEPAMTAAPIAAASVAPLAALPPAAAPAALPPAPAAPARTPRKRRPRRSAPPTIQPPAPRPPTLDDILDERR